jgi:hypothetical protein
MTRSVVVVILLAVLSPFYVLFASPAHKTLANLPACCRRDGKHHCAMVNDGVPSSQTRMNSVAPPCPFQGSHALVSHVVASLPNSSDAHYGQVLSHPAIHEQALAAMRVSQARSHQKRGPPLQPLN